uniref:RBR-type E3 ubiquitin transferase n=1 Tax=Neogobius melanostomus TaxID=47308 RepID=A0A8C6SMK5_9GOBI
MVISLYFQMEEVRRRAQSLLASSGQAQDVKADVQLMPEFKVVACFTVLTPPCRHFPQVLETLGRLVKALGILEKYGCNLTCPTRPKYWKSVKHNNPVFRSTVDAVKGGRSVLYLYGYTNQQIDGLSFPDDVSEPDVDRVAAVTVEVMTLRTEVDLLLKVCDATVIPKTDEPPKCTQEVRLNDISEVYSFVPDPCTICGSSSVHMLCLSCDHKLCQQCDRLYHSHPERVGHHRTVLSAAKTSNRSSLSSWECGYCTTVNELRAILCFTCERPRLSAGPSSIQDAPLSLPQSPSAEWQCKSCTMLNQGSSVLCQACERPRLATRPVAAVPAKTSTITGPESLALPVTKWTCQFCTFVNTKPGSFCEMCSLSCKDAGGAVSLPAALCTTAAPAGRTPPPIAPKPKLISDTTTNTDTKRQRALMEDGLNLINKIRVTAFCLMVECFLSQRMCRRLLALYELPSWGRCELVLSLLQEPNMSYNMEDVVQAVKDSPDREFIKRLLQNECRVCFSNFPLNKVSARLSSFTLQEEVLPDINDPEQLDNYFSTLDIQLKNCLTDEVYNLFHRKLTEHTLMKDPKFLWCCHCTSGFINDMDQVKVTCPTCHKSFCCKCKKPWEPQHQDVTCEQFQQWKRDNDPDYQRQGLAGYLRDNGITCPSCRFQYALTKGGCMHFTCSQCRHQFCSGCNNPFHKTACRTPVCNMNGLHAHHPRDCLFYLRDWEPGRLQELLKVHHCFKQRHKNDKREMAAQCGVMEQKDNGQQLDQPCGGETRPGQAGLCDKHYREYLVSLINAHSLDPAVLYTPEEVAVACQRYQVTEPRLDESDINYQARQLQRLMAVPLGDKVPRVQ